MMTLLIVGLLLFLGSHSIRIVAEPWRVAQIARRGEVSWKRIVSLVSLAGFALVVYGYGQARGAPVVLWVPPLWTRHLAALLTLPAFVLIAAAYVRGNRIKAAVGHPMVAGVKVWAFAHLLANGNLADVVLFGAFLAWAIVDFIAARRRDRAAGTRYPVGTPFRDVVTVGAGVLGWALFAWVLHGPLIGVRPFG
jgi:uncharacterized membrane protein